MNESGFRDYQPTRVEPVSDVAEQAKAVGRDVQNAAVDLASTSAEALKGHASHAVEAAKELASSAQDRLQDKVQEQKGLGADYVNNFADAMRQAANHFDADVPVAGTYMRKAAGQIETAAGALREGNFNDLVQGAQKFARSQPTAFFGLALLAGFGAVRFLKSASSESDRNAGTWSQPDRNVGNRSESGRRAGTSSFEDARSN
ncbi:MAG TPA: YtxH domain-containing protein [Roseiarcus sp.]